MEGGAVRPEFGPTLPELLSARRGVRPQGVAIAFAAVALVLGTLLATRGPWADPRTEIVHRGDPTFRISYPSGILRPAAARPGELQRLVGVRGRLGVSITVRRFEPSAPVDADPFGSLPLYADQHVKRLAASLAGFDLRSERHLRVNWDPGYDMRFRYRDGGRRMYGRDMIAFPTERSRSGAVLLSLRHRSLGRERAGDGDDLAESHRALRSFAFGLE